MPDPLGPRHVDVRPVADEEALAGRDPHVGQGPLEDVGARLPPAHGVRHDHGLEAAEDAARPRGCAGRSACSRSSRRRARRYRPLSQSRRSACPGMGSATPDQARHVGRQEALGHAPAGSRRDRLPPGGRRARAGDAPGSPRGSRPGAARPPGSSRGTRRRTSRARPRAGRRRRRRGAAGTDERTSRPPIRSRGQPAAGRAAPGCRTCRRGPPSSAPSGAVRTASAQLGARRPDRATSSRPAWPGSPPRCGS